MKLYRVGLLRPNEPEYWWVNHEQEEAERQIDDLRELLDIHGWGRGELKFEVLECEVIESTSYTG